MVENEVPGTGSHLENSHEHIIAVFNCNDTPEKEVVAGFFVAVPCLGPSRLSPTRRVFFASHLAPQTSRLVFLHFLFFLLPLMPNRRISDDLKDTM
jgi:hypothetical protein